MHWLTLQYSKKCGHGHNARMIRNLAFAVRFDPAGHKRLSTGTDGMRKCKVRICELMTAGVVLSRLIATRQKLKFVLGGGLHVCNSYFCFQVGFAAFCS